MAAGNAAGAQEKVAQAVKLLELALPDLPMGAEVHKAVSGAISSLAKHAPQSSDPGLSQSALRDLMQHAAQQAPLMALMRGQGAAP